MIDDVVLGQAFVPDGVELRLVQHGADFTILLEDNELMSTQANASEEALAVMTCEKLSNRDTPQLLIGGYGMGFTLRAALAVLGDEASIMVAEIVPEILAWARGPMKTITDGCLDDPRVRVIGEDVALLIDSAWEAYDAILLDVDNGPEGLTRQLNDGLYSVQGLQRAMLALRPGGILAIWSAFPEPLFTQRLHDVGYDVTETVVRARANNKGFRHLIWFARKP
ncbi:spermidine synthase [Novosphingobium resinovorum]|uniref:spermidine synthase n=1 Tax=Novosphingobium resinovorum TaxID=158500 RepID=UPI002ED46BA5|nr:spermidine synthase [Novosphingobium resinovorum]